MGIGDLGGRMVDGGWEEDGGGNRWKGGSKLYRKQIEKPTAAAAKGTVRSIILIIFEIAFNTSWQGVVHRVLPSFSLKLVRKIINRDARLRVGKELFLIRGVLPSQKVRAVR